MKPSKNCKNIFFKMHKIESDFPTYVVLKKHLTILRKQPLKYGRFGSKVFIGCTIVVQSYFESLICGT